MHPGTRSTSSLQNRAGLEGMGDLMLRVNTWSPSPLFVPSSTMEYRRLEYRRIPSIVVASLNWKHP